MRTYTADEDIGFPVVFQQQGQPHIPDVGTVVYTLYDQAGSAIAGQTNVPVTTNSTTAQAILTLPASVNGIVSGRFAKRTVAVRYQKGGVPFRITTGYRLVPFLNHTVTPVRVRSFLGVNETELPDDDLDVASSYLRVEDMLGQVLLTGALSSGTVAELSANEAILMQVVLDILPSLRLRIAQSETDGPKSFERVAIKDFDQLERDARQRLADALTVIQAGLQTAYTLVVVTQDADVVTG